jgi:hypothetical protein
MGGDNKDSTLNVKFKWIHTNILTFTLNYRFLYNPTYKHTGGPLMYMDWL